MREKMVKSVLAAFLLLMLAAFPVWAQEATDDAPTDEAEVDMDAAAETPMADEESDSASASQSIAELAAGDDSLSTLVSALGENELVENLGSEDEFTVFAPINDAFDALPEGALDELLADPAALDAVLRYHVIESAYSIDELLELGGLPTLEGLPVTITQVDGEYYVNNARVLTADLPASNGVVHIIDSVLIPPAEEAQEEVIGPRAAFRVAHFVGDAGSVDVYLQNGEDILSVTDLNFGDVSEFSVVAPGTYTVTVTAAGGTQDDPIIGPLEVELADQSLATIAAIGTAANGSITAQVIDESGENLPEGSARLTFFHGIENAPAINVSAEGNLLVEALAFPGAAPDADGVFSIDVPAGTYNLQVTSVTDNAVLFDVPDVTLEANQAYLVAAIGFANAPSGQVALYPTDLTALETDLPTVLEAAEQDGRFSTLLVALEAAGLTETLESEGPFTVFAPTNDAFAEIPQADLDGLLEDPETLTNILDYHVVEGVYTTQDLIDMADEQGMVNLTTVQGEDLPIRAEAGDLDVALFINDDIQFNVTDILASNGVIHGIDTVLMPGELGGTSSESGSDAAATDMATAEAEESSTATEETEMAEATPSS
jgi:transforming growth factor-beta-induced protein